jgi:hypothetical protein
MVPDSKRAILLVEKNSRIGIDEPLLSPAD